MGVGMKDNPWASLIVGRVEAKWEQGLKTSGPQDEGSCEVVMSLKFSTSC